MNNNIEITVKTSYVRQQSLPDESKYVYAYNITITNNNDQSVKLISRYWHITDARNQVQEVEGLGVIGEQPVIKPGESYSYTSGVILETSTGIMSGHYKLTFGEGHEFQAEIPTFALAQPKSIH